uniref:Uncharacterized protein n=1 Tax=Anguilla anguilla TaxID=7936 RepID=A0A0E9UGC1_ANGAN
MGFRSIYDANLAMLQLLYMRRTAQAAHAVCVVRFDYAPFLPPYAIY